MISASDPTKPTSSSLTVSETDESGRRHVGRASHFWGQCRRPARGTPAAVSGTVSAPPLRPPDRVTRAAGPNGAAPAPAHTSRLVPSRTRCPARYTGVAAMVAVSLPHRHCFDTSPLWRRLAPSMPRMALLSHGQQMTRPCLSHMALLLPLL